MARFSIFHDGLDSIFEIGSRDAGHACRSCQVRFADFQYAFGVVGGIASQLQYGLIAQQVAGVFPDLVATSSPTSLTPDGTLTLNYDGLIAPIIEAIKELAAKVSGFAQSVTTNVLTAATGNFNNLCVKKADGSNVCITGDQLSNLLNQSGQQGSSITISDTSSQSGALSTATTTDQNASTTPI